MPARWRPLAALMRDDFESYQGALRDPAVSMARAPGGGPGRGDSLHAAFGAALRAAMGDRGPGSRRTALATLRLARDVEQRALAASVLVAWPQHDATWHALADAQRDPSALVRTVAGQSLRALLAGAPRRVDWRPAAGTLRALLDGTNPFAFDLMVDVLSTTGDGPRLRRALLAGGGGDLVVELLGSREPAARVRAYRFLRTMSARDLGPAPDPWRRWMAGL
jgi:hypothetical protein